MAADGTIRIDIGPSIMPVIDIFKEAFQGITPAVKEVADAVYGFIKDIVRSLQSGGLKKAVQTVGSLFTDLSQILSKIAKAVLPFSVDKTGLDVHSIAAYLEDTVRQGRASMSSAIMARAEQQIINQLDTSAIARACREGCEAADVTVEGELRAEFSADGRQLGEVVTPYVNRNMGLQRRALLRGGKA